VFIFQSKLSENNFANRSSKDRLRKSRPDKKCTCMHCTLDQKCIYPGRLSQGAIHVMAGGAQYSAQTTLTNAQTNNGRIPFLNTFPPSTIEKPISATPRAILMGPPPRCLEYRSSFLRVLCHFYSLKFILQCLK
jgi:hypothetical protein